MLPPFEKESPHVWDFHKFQRQGATFFKNILLRDLPTFSCFWPVSFSTKKMFLLNFQRSGKIKVKISGVFKKGWKIFFLISQGERSFMPNFMILLCTVEEQFDFKHKLDFLFQCHSSQISCVLTGRIVDLSPQLLGFHLFTVATNVVEMNEIWAGQC